LGEIAEFENEKKNRERSPSVDGMSSTTGRAEKNEKGYGQFE